MALASASTHEVVDVHTHLTDDVFKKDLNEVVERAQKNGVKAALVMTETQNDIDPVLDLYKRFPNFVLPCIGLHPLQPTGELNESGRKLYRSIALKDYEGFEEKLIEHAPVIGAIGEVGLDFQQIYAKSTDDKEIQKLILHKQAKLAQDLDLPLNVHSRSAGKPAILTLKSSGARNVLLHAFDGRPSIAMEGVSYGFYFSVTAAIDRDPQMEKMVKTLPIDHLMLESDSPAIAPVKGARNEPANVSMICERIARIKKIDERDVRMITTENALKLFPKLKELMDT